MWILFSLVGYSDTLCSPSVSSHLCWQLSITDTSFREWKDKAQFTNPFPWKQTGVMTETVCCNWISCCHLFSHKNVSFKDVAHEKKKKRITLIHSLCYSTANMSTTVHLPKRKCCICSSKIQHEVIRSVALKAYKWVQLC